MSAPLLDGLRGHRGRDPRTEHGRHAPRRPRRRRHQGRGARPGRLHALVGHVCANGVSFLHLRWNRGKRSLALDLRSTEGVEVFRPRAPQRGRDRRNAGGRIGRAWRGLRELRAGESGNRALRERRGSARPARFATSQPTVSCTTCTPDSHHPNAPPKASRRSLRTTGTSAPRPARATPTIGILAAVTRARPPARACALTSPRPTPQSPGALGELDQRRRRRVPAELAGEPVPPARAADDARGPAMGDAVRYQYYDTSDNRLILFQASERHFFERFCRGVGVTTCSEGTSARSSASTGSRRPRVAQ